MDHYALKKTLGLLIPNIQLAELTELIAYKKPKVCIAFYCL